MPMNWPMPMNWLMPVNWPILVDRGFVDAHELAQTCELTLACRLADAREFFLLAYAEPVISQIPNWPIIGWTHDFTGASDLPELEHSRRWSSVIRETALPSKNEIPLPISTL